MSDTALPQPGNGPGGPAPGPGAVAERGNAADATALRARVTELEDLWRRALADADNLRKRHAREMERARDRERAEVARDWLPVLDDLERALQHSGSDPGAIIEGVRAVRDEAVGVLARLGFPRRDDLGARFDPARHDAVASILSADEPPGTVVEVVHPAYGDGDHQLRPARVVVARSE
jgi:molecular chaperone GrpE